MGALSLDPFVALKQLDEVRSQLRDLGIPDLAVIEGVRSKIDSECLIWEVEFWGAFHEFLRRSRMGGRWETTNRRLVNRAVFVSLEGRTVGVEGVANCSPFVPNVMRALSAQLNSAPITDAELESILVNARQSSRQHAVIRIGIQSRRSLSSVRPRGTEGGLLEEPDSRSLFTPLSRPMFRNHISEILRRGLETPDGRMISLGTTDDQRRLGNIFARRRTCRHVWPARFGIRE